MSDPKAPIYVRRVAAVLLDSLYTFLGGLAFFIVAFLILMAVMIGVSSSGLDDGPSMGASGAGFGAAVPILTGVALALSVLIVVGASCGAHASADSGQYQGTWGKRQMGLKVTDLQGNRLAYGPALGRSFLRLGSLLIAPIVCVTTTLLMLLFVNGPSNNLVRGIEAFSILISLPVYLAPLFGPKVAIHDYLVGARVVRVPGSTGREVRLKNRQERQRQRLHS